MGFTHNTPHEESRVYAGEAGNAVRAYLDGRILLNQQADAEFIAHAPTDIASLLARVEELEKALDQATKKISENGGRVYYDYPDCEFYAWDDDEAPELAAYLRQKQAPTDALTTPKGDTLDDPCDGEKDEI